MEYRTILASGVLLLSLTAPAQAQNPFIFVGGGPTIPVSLYKNEDGAKTGWMATAGFGIPVGEKGLTLGGEVYYGTNKHEAPPAGDKTNLYGAGGFVTYRFGPSTKAGVYLLGSAGLMKHDYRSKTYPDEQGGNFELGWSAGAGVDIPAGKSANVFVETRYFQRGDTRFIPIFAGVSFAVGKT